MKKIFLSLLLIFNGLYAGQSEKPIFLLLWSDTCSHCQAFISGTLQEEKIKQLLKNFDIEAINVNQQNQIPYDIDFTGIVPSIHIMNQQKNQIVNTITGNIPPDEMSKFLSKFLELYFEYQKSL